MRSIIAAMKTALIALLALGLVLPVFTGCKTSSPQVARAKKQTDVGKAGYKGWIRSVKLAKDGRSVLLQIPDIKPVNQMKMDLKLQSADAKPFNELVYLTINKVPEKK